MFTLHKANDVWTLTYAVGPLKRVLFLGAGVAGLAIAVFQGLAAGSFDRSTAAIAGGALLTFAVLAYWALSDAASSAVFDLVQRRLRITCDRPWFGPPRTCAFSDIASLRAVNRTGETTDTWEAVLELRDGTRIRLGREPEGSNERIRGYLEEIRKATGIAG